MSTKDDNDEATTSQPVENKTAETQKLTKEQEAFNVLVQAVDKASRTGVYSVQDGYFIHMALTTLSQMLTN